MSAEPAPIVASTPVDGVARRRITMVDLSFVLAVIVVGYFRYRILSAGGAPPTIDSGNWLAYGDEILGRGVRSTTIVYPPLVPLLTKASVSVFGLPVGISGIATAAAVAPAIGIYLALRQLGPNLVALAPSILLLGASSVGEPAAWGGFPQLIGFGLLPIALVRLDRMLRTWERRDALIAGLLFMGILATSHFVAALALIAGLVIALLVITRERPPGPRQTITALALFAAPSVWLIPVYSTLAGAFTNSARGVTFFNETTGSTLFDQIEFLYRDAPWLWRSLLVLAIVALPLFLKHRNTPLWRITAATITGIVVAVALTRESRFLYLLTPFTVMGLALWTTHFGEISWRLLRLRTPAQHRGRVAAGVFAALVLAGVWQAAVGLEFFESQRATYGVLTPELARGIELVAEATEPGETLAVTSLNDAPFGWWVEAIAERETYYGAPIQWLLFEDEIRRATIANDLFVPPFPDRDRMSEAADLGVDLVLVPTRWVFYDEKAMSDFAASYPGSVEYVTEELVVIDPTALP